jgi:hypothetical protein
MPEAKAYGFRAKGKVRFLSGVVTPAQPHYLYGLLDANVDPPLGRAPPILGIAASAGGYQVSSLFGLFSCSYAADVCLGSSISQPHCKVSPGMLLAGAQTAKHLSLAGPLVLLSIVFHLVALGCCFLSASPQKFLARRSWRCRRICASALSRRVSQRTLCLPGSSKVRAFAS